MTQTADKYRAPALEKGLDIIELLADYGDGLAQGDIARALDRSQSEIYRMLTTLVRRGYVVRSPGDDLYTLSLKMFALSQRHPPIGRLLETAAPQMRMLTRKAWQSCHLGMESNGDVVIVASAESPGNWGLALRVGTVIGLGNTGTGRVLAAFRPEDELSDLVAQHRLAVGEPPIDASELRDHIARIRELGYERMPSATAVGVTNLSYPVLNQDGRAIAVLTCPFLERIDDMKPPSQDEVHRMCKALAEDLTAFYCGTGDRTLFEGLEP
ncbi:MAG: IclR family transcriptional regulator [Epibacterium sp.]|jgi:DNA-binding IclR family transcriptional regulator